MYTKDLLHLDSCHPLTTSPKLAPQCNCITTPLKGPVWRKRLSGHQFVDYITAGITDGFRVGFNYAKCACSSAKGNMPSALQHPGIVEEYVSKTFAERRVIGPLPLGLVPRLQVSSFGVIPKKNQPNKWQLILDLSHPAEVSVNDGISESLSTLSYITIDSMTDKICQLGQGSLLAKMDVQMHPDDHWLLGMKWKEQYYIDTVLPFGLRSAPKIFTALADALQWIICRQGATWVAHYLDDFVTLGKPGTSDCAHNQTIISDVCASLGVPLARRSRVQPPVQHSYE